MMLDIFCERFSLTVAVLQKLNIMKITGPHALRFVTNQQLVELGGMEIGEIGDVRDAQEHWTLRQGQDVIVR